jgi:PAS domain S-box-containing protein
VAHLSRFGLQVRLVPALAMGLLACLAGIHLALLDQARDALTRAERARTELLARDALRALPSEHGTGLSASALRGLAQRHGLARLTLLDRSGRVTTASDGSTAGTSRRLPLDALAAGRTVGEGTDPARGGKGAVYVVHVPLLDPSGKLRGVLEAAAAAPELGLLEARVRLLWGLTSVSALVLVALSALFANWLSRPWRKLAAAVGERESADPDSLAAAFRTVAEKLRQQEDALDSMEGKAAGLADLARFAATASEMTTGVLVVDRQGAVAALNPMARQLLGGAKGEVRGQDLARVAAQVPALTELVRTCLETGRGLSREVLETRRPEGEIGHLGVALSPAPGGALVLMTDLTEIREVQAQARLRENLAAVGQLSAGIAHEFRNALATILGWARLLDKHDDPRVRGPVREIVREIDSVRGAVDEFLLYARPPDPVRSDVDVEELLRVCAAAAPAAVRVEIAGSFGLVVGDEGLLRRAFGNLLHNAGDVASELSRTVAVRITGRVVSSGRWLQIDVEDDGPGIPADRRAQVFLPFFTTRARGTGLGLALVQRTVVDAGGSIEVTEGPRGGALFRIRVPRKGPVTKRDRSSARGESGQERAPVSET